MRLTRNPEKLPPPMQVRALPLFADPPTLEEKAGTTSIPLDFCSACARAFDTFLANKTLGGSFEDV